MSENATYVADCCHLCQVVSINKALGKRKKIFVNYVIYLYISISISYHIDSDMIEEDEFAKSGKSYYYYYLLINSLSVYVHPRYKPTFLLIFFYDTLA